MTTPCARWQDDPAFMEFWRLYPRKEAPGGRNGAWGAYKRAITRETPERILEGLCAYPFSAEREYQPLASTFLNQDRFSGVTFTAPATVRAAISGPARNGALDLLSATGRTPEELAQEIDDRAAGRLIDHDDPAAGSAHDPQGPAGLLLEGLFGD